MELGLFCIYIMF